MGKNDLRDVLQSAMQFTSAAANFATPIYRERAVSELRTADLELQKGASEFLLSLSQRNDFENFDVDWENKKIDLYNSASEKVTSDYGKNELSAAYAELEVQQGLKIEQMKMKKEADWTLVNNQNYRNEINSSIAYTPEEKQKMNETTIISEFENGLIGYQDYDTKIRENGATNALSVVLKGGRAAMEGMDLNAAMDAIDADSYQLVLPDGKNLPMDQIKDTAKKTLTNEWNTKVKTMQGEHAGTLSEIYGSMLASGNAEYAYKGLAQIEKWTGYNLDKNERDEYAKRFSDFLKEKDPKKASQAALENMIEFEFEKAQRLVFQGEKSKNDPNRGYVNAETGKAAFQTVAEKILSDPANRDEEGKINPGAWEKYEKLKGSFFGEIEKRLPINNPEIASKFKSIKTKSEDIALKRYGAKKITELNETQRTEYDNLQSYVDGAMWDFLQSTNMATVTSQEADAVFENILTATLGKEMEILKKNPITGESGFKRKGLQSEDDLAAQYIKAAENPDLAYKDTFGNERWVPGVKEGTEAFTNWARSQISKVTGVKTDGISQSFLETQGGKDVDAVSVFTTTDGKQYKYTVSDNKPVLNQKTSSGDWRPVEIGTSEQLTDAKKKETKKVYDSKIKSASEYLQKNEQKIYANPMPGYTQEEWDKKPESERFMTVDEWITKDPDAFLSWIATFSTKKSAVGGGR